MSKLGDRRHRHDAFFQRAQKGGFVARAVFKLEQLDKKLHLFKRDARVLDLGCKPGSWLQYARKACGDAAPLVGLDRTELEVAIPGARLLVGDVMSVAPATLLGQLDRFDVVLSDMAPDTSGIRSLDQARSEALFERALEIALATLAPGGNFVGKLFQGPDFQRLQRLLREHFEEAKVVKPESSRKESLEIYLAGLRLRGGAASLPR